MHFYHVRQSFAGLGWGGADNVPWHLTCCYASTCGYATRTWVWSYADRRCCYACAYLAHTSSYSWKCGLYVQNVLNRCWICVEFLWIICRIYVDYMSNKCWIDVEYIQSRLEANQWKTRLCWSYMVKPVGARLRDDRPLLVRRKFWFTAPCHVTTWSKALNCLSLPWSRLESGVSIVGISLIFL